jgi:hypothetical protein
MAWEQPLFNFSAKTAKDLSSYQHQVVRLTTAEKLTFVSCAAVANVAIGVLQDQPTSGMDGNVMIVGISKVKAGGAVSRGQLLGLQLASTTYPGMLVAATTASKGSTKPVGRALQGAAQAGDIIPALINFLPVGLGTS